jgi:apoptosis-inducing factor 2
LNICGFCVESWSSLLNRIFPYLVLSHQRPARFPKTSAPLQIRSFGSKPDTSFLSSLSGSHLTPTGTVQILPILQLPGYPNIFALGDIIDWKEQKQAAKVALGLTGVVVNNVLEVLKEINGVSASGTKLKEYKGSTEMIIVTNGKSQGLGYLDFLWGIVLPSWVVAMLKSKTLMVAKDRAGTGN